MKIKGVIVMKNTVNKIIKLISMIREANPSKERRNARCSTSFTVYTSPICCGFTAPGEDSTGFYYIDREQPFSEVGGQLGAI